MRGKGAWYVVGQGILLAVAGLAPLLGARSSGWPVVLTIMGVVLLVAGLGIAAAAALALGPRSFSAFPRPRTGSALVRSGVYGVVRHPIYSGLTLTTLGWGLAWSSVVALAAALALFVFLDIKARREERWLRAKFSDYAEYQRQVRKLVPFVY